MAQDSIQTQVTKQTTTLMGIQVEFANLLELPLEGFIDRVNNAVEANAALENGKNEDNPAEMDDYGMENSSSEEEDETNGTDETYGVDYEPSPVQDADDYINADETPEYVKNQIEYSRDPMEMLPSDNNSFYEELQRQIAYFPLNEHEREILDYLICSLDDDGYLRKDLNTILDELEIYNNIQTSLEELEYLLSTLQRFEPRGVGAHDLQECLHLQLTDPQIHSPWKEQGLKVVDRYFKDFMSNRWDLIAKHLKLNEEDTDKVCQFLRHLNPRPGRAFSESNTIAAPTVIPDFYVHVNDCGEAEVELNNEHIPELHVSSSYCDTLKIYTDKKKELSKKEHDDFITISNSVEGAKGFINMIKRRNNTMLTIMRSIVKLQRPFFDSDDETLLRPLKLQEIADRAGIPTSTASRAAKDKYVQTDYGTYPLKFFFSTQFTTKDGEQLSSRDVRFALKELVDKEDKKNPYTDLTLVRLLRAQGYPIARRTVGKYRDKLQIPPSNLRRE